MKPSWAILLFAGTVSVFVTLSASAQGIRYLTYRAPHIPIPPMGLIPTNAAPAAVPAFQAPVRPPPIPVKPSLDKAELERRVVAFQKQRAEEGSVSAQYELGMRYLQGNGVEQDRVLARKWLRLAAQGGDTQAQIKLRELDSSRN